MPADAAVTVAAIADGYVEERCALVPIEASYLGVAGHDHELGERVARAVMEERLGLGWSVTRPACPTETRTCWAAPPTPSA